MNDMVTGYSPVDSWLSRQGWFNSSFDWLKSNAVAQAEDEDSNLILSIGFALSIISAIVFMAMGGGVLELASVLLISGYLGYMSNTDGLPTSHIVEFVGKHLKLVYLVVLAVNAFNLLDGLFTGQLFTAIVGLITSTFVLTTVFVAVGIADLNRGTEA